MKVLARQFGNQPVMDVVRKLRIEDVDDVEFTKLSIDLPLTRNHVDAIFGDEFDFTPDARGAVGIESVETSFAQATILQTDEVVVGFRIHASADPVSFVARGRTTSGRQALFEFGTPAWMALHEMAHTYQFRWQVAQRYVLHEDSLANIMFLKRPTALKEAPRAITVKHYVDELNTRLKQQNVTELFVPDSYEVETTPIDAQYMGALAQQPHVTFQKKALLSRGYPMGIVAQVVNASAQRRMQALLQTDLEVAEGQPIIFRGGHIHIEFGLKGCEVAGREVFRELLTMPEIFDIAAPSETLADYRASQTK